MIPASAQQLIRDWPLGFVATADADGVPNVSPKGTFQVLDDTTIAFAEIRSPGTLANLAVRREVEINFVDILSRKGVRVRGEAGVHEKGSSEFEALFPRFQGIWPELEPMMNALVVIDVQACKPLASPIYEAGADETGIRAAYAQKIAAIAAGETA